MRGGREREKERTCKASTVQFGTGDDSGFYDAREWAGAAGECHVIFAMTSGVISHTRLLLALSQCEEEECVSSIAMAIVMAMALSLCRYCLRHRGEPSVYRHALRSLIRYCPITHCSVHTRRVLQYITYHK